jgi:hypothetical protein
MMSAISFGPRGGTGAVHFSKLDKRGRVWSKGLGEAGTSVVWASSVESAMRTAVIVLLDPTTDARLGRRSGTR